MTFIFSMGLGLNGRKPGADDLLNCIASDAIDDQSFNDWCSDFGFDPDSRKAERIYRACERQTKRARQFLGHAAFRDLVENTERL